MSAVHPFIKLRLRISNVFLYDGGAHGHWLIDTGHRLGRARLLGELSRLQVEPERLAGVLLTHRHSDHAGNAAFLKQNFGIRVYAHGADAAILSGRAPRPRLQRGAGNAIAGLFARFENRWPAEPFDAEALAEGDEIAGLTVHWAPGHTEGSIMLEHKESHSLLSGDMLLNAAPPLTVRPGLALPYPTFACDLQQAFSSLQHFHASGVDYENLLPGHGPVLLGKARDQVGRLLAEAHLAP
jgi:glyoxylase-like metal-dependent hydrolase (beta-lactamase superfamily II)